MRHRFPGLCLLAFFALTVSGGCPVTPSFMAWINPDQEEIVIRVGDSVELKAVAEGGIKPYSFWWVSSSQSGPGRSGAAYRETFPLPGRFVIELTVTDGLGARVYDRIAVLVLPATPGPAPGPGSEPEPKPEVRFRIQTEVRGSGRIGFFPEQETYAPDTKVAIFAFPDEGHQFVGWNGDVFGGDNPLEVVINRDLKVIANFRPLSFPPPPPPEVNLLVNGKDGLVRINVGDHAVLSWYSKNAITAFATGHWSGDRKVAGREIIGPFHIPGAFGFTLTVVGPGGSAEDSVTVEVQALPEPPLEIVSLAISPPSGGRECYLVGEKAIITVRTNRDGEIHYLLPDSTVVGSAKTLNREARLEHIWPFPIQKGQIFVWPEDKDFEPFIKWLMICVSDNDN